jgi:hypothetical protein
MLSVTPGLLVLWFGAELLAAQTEPAQVVFSGGQREIQTVLHNSTAAPVEHSLVGRAAILASSVAAPVAEIRRADLVKVPAGESVVVTWRVEVPPVQRITRFALTLSGADTRSLGQWTFFAVPGDLPMQVASLLGSEVIVQTGLEDLQRALVAAGIRKGTIDSPPPTLRTAIIGPWKSGAPRQLREAIRSLSERGVTCIVLGGEIAVVPRLLMQRMGKGTVISISGVDFENFSSNAAAQLALWDACRIAAAPDELPAWIKN